MPSVDSNTVVWRNPENVALYRSILQHLLCLGLLQAQSIVSGGVRITEISRRNANFRIDVDDGRGFFVKMARSPVTAATLTQEADLYASFRRTPDFASFAEYLPLFVDFDFNRRVLVLELLRDANDFAQYNSSRRKPSPLLARCLGRALAILHGLGRDCAARRKVSDSGARWVLSLHCPGLHALRDMSPAELQLVRLLQSHGDPCRLDGLRAAWKDSTIVHGDIRMQNCLAVPSPGSTRLTRLKLIDWELGGKGDPCWDIGCVFAQYLDFALTRTALPAGENLGIIEVSGEPLLDVQVALRAFRDAYFRGWRPQERESSSELLTKATGFAGIRLFQTALERARESISLDARTICLAQLGVNVIAKPQDALVRLCGLLN
jgi:hypothetical protein